MSEEMRSDRVGEYLIPKVQEEFLFDELSDGYLLEKAEFLRE